MKRAPVLVSFVLFIALCASAAYWVLQFWRPPTRPVAAPVAGPAGDVQLDAAATLFGGRPAAVGVASNFQLKGVILAKNGTESVAIISADGKPAQAVGMNTEFQPGVSMREVHPHYVLLSEGGVMKRVSLPEVTKASPSDFTPGGMQPVPVPPPPPQMQMAPQMPVQVVTPGNGQAGMQAAGQAQGVAPPAPSQALPTGMPGGAPAGVQNGVPPPSPNLQAPPGGQGGYSQPRRQ